jgi:hypothetical protein
LAKQPEGGEPPLQFSDRDKLEAWLQGQKRKAAVAIAARAALRVAPFAARELVPQGGKLGRESFENLTSVIFRATAVARVAGAYPTRAKELRATRAAAAASSSGSVSAAAAAAAAAVNAPVAIWAVYSADAAASAAYWAEVSADADGAALTWDEVSADARALARGESLAGAPLWTLSRPDWSRKYWERLKAALPKDENWRVWIDWYQDRIIGRAYDEAKEMIFATVPEAEWQKGPSAANKWIADRLAELNQEERKPPSSWDFFISYSSVDEPSAREVAAGLEEAGHSTFAQFKDIAPGNNFVREMQGGLEKSKRIVALLSPEYEKSDHCQAEWAAAYNRDPSGKKRVLIPLLLRETALNSLAGQVVYKSLVGLTSEARKKAILEAIAAKAPLPKPAENVASLFAFGWNASAKITILAGPQNTPVFPHAGGKEEHEQRLAACRKTVERLLAALRAQRYNARRAYLETLEFYLDDLPTAPGDGNLLLADSQARNLRGIFEDDASVLPRDFAEQLNRVLEFHMALRIYYPGVGRFYEDVKSGRLSQPLPKDAVESFTRTVEEHTPEVFEPEVSSGLQEAELSAPIADRAEQSASTEPAPITPRPDPLGELDPVKAHDFGVASSINALYEAFLKGKDLSQAVKGWDELAHKLGENAGPVIAWLRGFLGQ